MSELKLVARLVLLATGIALLIPDTVAPILAIGVGIVTAQKVLGLAAVILALYFLIKKVP